MDVTFSALFITTVYDVSCFRLEIEWQKRHGREFGPNGDRYFIASNGIILNSNEPNLRFSDNTWTLHLPMTSEGGTTVVLPITARNKYFVKGLSTAINEYNDAVLGW